MSDPAPATNSKKAPLLVESDLEPVSVDTAPPSYTDATASTVAYGDGNVFSDSPRPRPAMTYSLGRQEAYQPREKKGWSFGFFDCFKDPNAAAKAYCCPCISYAQTRHRLHSPGTPAPVCSMPCVGYCMTASCVPGMEFIFGFLQRGEVRNRLGIQHAFECPATEGRVRLPTADTPRQRIFESLEAAGGYVDDLWRHFFCSCCALAQEDREVRAWEQQLGVGLRNLDEEEVIGEEGIRAEGERLLGAEREGLQGLRG